MFSTLMFSYRAQQQPAEKYGIWGQPSADMSVRVWWWLSSHDSKNRRKEHRHISQCQVVLQWGSLGGGGYLLPFGPSCTCSKIGNRTNFYHFFHVISLLPFSLIRLSIFVPFMNISSSRACHPLHYSAA